MYIYILTNNVAMDILAYLFEICTKASVTYTYMRIQK